MRRVVWAMRRGTGSARTAAHCGTTGVGSPLDRWGIGGGGMLEVVGAGNQRALVWSNCVEACAIGLECDEWNV